MPCILLCVFLLFSGLAQALVIDDDARQIPLGRYAHVFEDVRGDTSLEDVTSKAMQGSFRPLGKDALSAGYTASVFWIRLKLTYQSEQNAERPWFLAVPYPPLDDVRVYASDNRGGFRLVQHTGDTLPFAQRQIEHSDYVFELTLQPRQERTVYLRVATKGPMIVPMQLWEPRAYLEALPGKTYTVGMIIGVLLVMVVYNLFIFVTVRDASYLYYILYIASFGLYLLSFNGIAMAYLWPESPWWANVSVAFWMGAATLFGSQFVRTFLQLAQHSVWADRAFLALIACAGLMMVMSLTDHYLLAMKFGTGLTLVLITLAFGSGILAWSRGVRMARYFIIAWSCVMVGVLITALVGLGYITPTFLTLHAGQFGCALEGALLSLALADRINAMKEDRAQILQDASHKLEELNKELAGNNILKDQFLSTVTHELRTPMNGVIGSLDLMRTVPLNEELSQYHKTAYASARSMMRIVNDILFLTELQAGRLYPLREPFSLRGLLDGVRVRYQWLAEEKGLDFFVREDGVLPDILEGDAGKIAQSLNCLIDNAIKFTCTGWVSVSFSLGEANRGPLRIEVSDSGVGFAEHQSEQLYQQFQQLDGSNSRAYGGLGIGLSICRQLVELLGGTLKHESILGQGSCFSIELPVMVPVQDAGVIETMRPVGPPVRQPQQCTVLVVKHNPVNRLLIRGMLLKMGYQARCVGSGAEALEVLHGSNRVDAVLLDCHMPLMDGFATCRALRQIPGCQALPVFALTNIERVGDRQRYISAGMTDYLTKPVKFEQLRKTLHDWVLCQEVETPLTPGQ